MTMVEMKDAMPDINNDTGVSLKMVISAVCLAVFLVSTYFNLYARQTEILFKVERIEESIGQGGRWSREDMGHFANEMKILNPEIKVPEVDSGE